MIRSNLRLAIFVSAVLVSRGLPLSAQSASAESNPHATATASRPATQADADLSAIQRPPLPEFHPQQPKRIQLANGMVIFLQEDHELPLIDGTAFIYGGGRNQPAEKVGLVSVYGSAWRTGGTKTKTGDELDDLLEARAARVETSGGGDYTTMRLSCLKDDFDLVLGVFNDLLRNPEFRQEKIELAKNGVRTNIARRNDDINGIAGREGTKLGYGPQSPYARVPEYATLAAVTRQDLLDWHEKYVHPNNIILGISGDFDAAAMEKKLRSTFDSWPKGQAHDVFKISITD